MSTPPGDPIAELFRAQRANHPAIKRTTAEQRAAKLTRLRIAIERREAAIRQALYADFRKAPTEVDVTELVPVLMEIKEAIKHVHRWMRPHRVTTPMTLAGTHSAIHYEPRGVTLVIGPWNYPFQLVLAPLVAAIAAGNCAIVKPSELTPATSALVAELIAEVFPASEIAVVQGDAQVAQRLLALPFDHFFFTGSTRVGKVVAEAAARHLASSTLELGGKSPCVVDDSADLAAAARRIAWGKFVNSGQTCIAPDYVMVSKRREQALVDALGAAIRELYGDGDAAWRASPDLCRIINARNYERLTGLVDGTLAAGATVALGGGRDAAERYLAPTVLTGVAPDAPIMSEEIFGPILPILTYERFEDCAPFIAARDKPLALYVFAADEAKIDALIAETTAGGTCVNNTILHFANHNLPFGGVGPSGSGNYHGFFGFKAFSHERAVLRQGRIDLLSQVYPPYTPKVQRVLGLMRKLFT